MHRQVPLIVLFGVTQNSLVEPKHKFELESSPNASEWCTPYAAFFAKTLHTYLM